ncbi:hypothetical protein ACM25O_17470 [Sulfitobacter pontiacus]
MQSGENIYDAYINDSDLIGTHWRYQQARNLSDWMEGPWQRAWENRRSGLVMNGGRIEQIGSPAEGILQSPQVLRNDHEKPEP